MSFLLIHFSGILRNTYTVWINTMEKIHWNFLIERTGARITVLKNGRFCKFYKIEYDKNLLAYLYAFADKLKYLIYFCGDMQGDLGGNISCEIIKISKIPELINKALRYFFCILKVVN